MRKIFINQNNIFRAQQNEYLIRKCLCIDNNINTNRILSNGSVNMYDFVPFTSPWCIRRPTELSTTSNRMCRTTLFSSDARSRCSTQLTLAPNWTIKMSSTIDQQRQRVEQEMTKMVDDVDRSFLRKLQVKSLMISSSQAHAFTHYRNMSFLAICIYKYRLYCVVNVIPARNAFMRCQVLWRQKCKHWHCPKLHWTLLAAGESCPTLHPIGNGRISRKIATMRYGMLWRHNISFPFTWIYMFGLRFFSNATMTSKCKCRRSHQKIKSPNIQHNLNDVPSNVWINILILYRKCSKQWSQCWANRTAYLDYSWLCGLRHLLGM